jgi:coatomer subunit beta'
MCSVRTGQWVGDCFVYTNSTNRLNYLVGDQTYTVSHFDQPYYVLGYLPRDGRVYVCDKDVSVTSFALSVSVIEYQTLVLRGDLESATEMLNQGDIPEEQKNKIARFLEGQGYKEQALEVATDSEHRFELALGLNQLSIALELAREADVEHKWKTVGDAALSAWDIALAEECFRHAKDLGSLLLLYTSSADEEGLRSLAAKAQDAGQHNVAFTSLWQVGDVDACLDVLLKTNRTAEAVLFAQTYKPSRCKEIVGEWKTGLEKGGKAKVARLIGVPGDDEEMFPEWEEYLRLESEGGSHADLIDVHTATEGDEPAEAADEDAQADSADAEEAGEEDDDDEATA